MMGWPGLGGNAWASIVSAANLDKKMWKVDFILFQFPHRAHPAQAPLKLAGLPGHI